MVGRFSTAQGLAPLIPALFKEGSTVFCWMKITLRVTLKKFLYSIRYQDSYLKFMENAPKVFPLIKEQLKMTISVLFLNLSWERIPSPMWETWVQSLGWEDPLEKGTVTHSSILAWRIPWTI